MDKDLQQYLDRKFSGLDERFLHIDEKFSQMDEKFSRIDERFSQMDEKFSRIDERFSQMDEKFFETRRHFDVVAESLRSETRQVAEGVVLLGERMDRVELGVRSEIQRVEQELGAMIRFSYAELERRMKTLEDDLQLLKTRVSQIEARG